MRRMPSLRQENQIALALAEIERLKAITTRTTDGRVIVTVPGTTPGDGHTPGGDLPPLETSAHVLYGSKHTNSFFVSAAEGVSLTIFIEAGQIWAGGSFFNLAEATLQMTDAATNYVHVTSAGVLASNTTSFPLDSAPLATVVTAAGAITSVNDRRGYMSTIGSMGVIDHDLLNGLADDDHFQYALLAGRAGGQNIIGGTGAGEALILTSNTANDGSVIVPDGLLTVGLDDTTRARIHLFGPTAGNQGGAFLLYLSGAHDAVFDNWTVDTLEDDLRFATSDAVIINLMTAEGQFQLSGQGFNAGLLVGGDCLWYRTSANVWRTPDAVVVDGVIIGSSTITATGGLRAGADDNTRGVFYLYGAGAGSTQGGNFRMYLAADHDGVFDYWSFDVDSDDLRIFSSDGVAVHKFLAGGNVLLDGAVEIEGALNHDGSTVGFYGSAPVAKPAATVDLLDGLISQGLVTAGAPVGYYASMYCYDGGANHVITGTGIGNKMQITCFAVNGEALGATPDHTNDHITIDNTGKYLVTVSMAVDSGAGSGFKMGYACYINNGATLFEALHGHRDFDSGGSEHGSMSMSAVVALTAADTLEVWLWNETNTTDIVVDDITLTVVRVGD